MRYTLNIILVFLSIHAFHQRGYGQDVSSPPGSAKQLSFNRNIRPLLSDRCFLCHGPDRSSEQAQQSDLRLDEREFAVEYGVFDFDDVSTSEILLRIKSDDPDYQMPPPGSHKSALTVAEIERISLWIRQGAPYEKHWAYIPPNRPEAPAVSSPTANPIDAFVLKTLEDKSLQPSRTANRETLVRRVCFDLTGLPPTIEQIRTFVQDPRPDAEAYERLVDQLLSSNAYGEHMARHWLDASRYADTSGYQYDREREQWVWRDWVIHAFNTNKPFDEFTIDQIAGDLRPDADEKSILATGFNRNHPITIEGGVVDEEYRTEYVIDRVVTTSTVWLGQTFLCARCHDHKYDPISQQDFFRFFSFFNNVPEKGLNGFDPKRTLPSPLAAENIERLHQRLVRIESELASLELPLDQWQQRWREELPSWTTPLPEAIDSAGGADAQRLDDGSILMTGKNPPTDRYEITLPATTESVLAIQLEAICDPSLTNGSASRGSNGNFVLTQFVVEAAFPDESNPNAPPNFKAVKIASAWADYEQNGFPIAQAIDGVIGKKAGWAVDGNQKPENRIAQFTLAAPIPASSRLRIRMHHDYGLSHQIGRFRLSLSPRAEREDDLAAMIAIAPEKQTTDQKAAITQRLIAKYGSEQAKRVASEYNAAKVAYQQARSFPATMIMAEMPSPRPAYVLERGEYDQPRTDQPLQPGVPESLGPMANDLPPNRLGLAHWLVSPTQPLTARVTVNRFWQQLFGVGLVKTSEDFGSQGEFPSHPELLDWLAVDWMESGWNVKRLLKTIVTSNTYQQSSRLSDESFASDPENRLLARGPRIRLDGEEIRDSALAISGLLDRTLGGPSVYPYHPQGLWLEINNRPGFSRPYPHPTDTEHQFRRSMYSFWKRTVAPPSVATFDAPSREYCVVRRSRTNTPMQAFVTLHDPQFVEAARHLASRMLREAGDARAAQLEFGFQLATARKPNADEMRILREFFEAKIQVYQTDATSAEPLLNVGVSPIDTQLDRVELAAMTQVARMLLNLSEFLTKG